MLFQITHVTRYSYSERVFLDPHVLRMRPRADGTQRLVRFELQVEPKPRGMCECIDLDGNSTIEAWFEGPTSSFTIASRTEVETLRRNPFDFIVPAAHRRLPMSYPPEDQDLIRAYTLGARGAGPVADLAEATAREMGGEAVAFLTGLATSINGICTWTLREDGEPLLPEETLARRGGSCRDLAVLFIAACREKGLGARFVTGYYESPRRLDRRYLHAWAEVYLPGGGWRGFDPSRGLAVAEEHVALAACARSQGAAPIAGAFRGGGVRSTMSAEIEVRAVHGAAQ